MYKVIITCYVLETKHAVCMVCFYPYKVIQILNYKIRGNYVRRCMSPTIFFFFFMTLRCDVFYLIVVCYARFFIKQLLFSSSPDVRKKWTRTCINYSRLISFSRTFLSTLCTKLQLNFTVKPKNTIVYFYAPTNRHPF